VVKISAFSTQIHNSAPDCGIDLSGLRRVDSEAICSSFVDFRATWPVKRVVQPNKNMKLPEVAGTVPHSPYVTLWKDGQKPSFLPVITGKTRQNQQLKRAAGHLKKEYNI